MDKPQENALSEQPPPCILPFDVLTDVMSFASDSTIVSLMATCEAMYLEGAKYLGQTLATFDYRTQSFPHFRATRYTRYI